MEPDPLRAPAWRTSWTDFMTELRTHFGPTNPVRNAEIELNQLIMSSDSRLSEYLVRFNTLASRVAWGDAALCFKFYDGLPDRLKDRLALLGQPDTLRELVQVTARHDTLHWDRQAERKSNRRPEQRNPFVRPPPTSQFRTTTQPSSSNTTTTSPQPTTPHFQLDLKTHYPDGKVRPEELTHHRNSNLCLRCSKGGHLSGECSRGYRARATELPTPEPPQRTAPAATTEVDLEN